MKLQPTCSEAVFKLGEVRYEIYTDEGSSLDAFVKTLAEVDDSDVECYEPLDNIGGGADFELIERLIEIRKVLGKKIFKMLLEKNANFDDLDTQKPWLIRGDTVRELNSPSDFLKLKKTDKVFTGPDSEFGKLTEIFNEYSSGKIGRKKYIAKILANSFLEVRKCVEDVGIVAPQTRLTTIE